MFKQSLTHSARQDSQQVEHIKLKFLRPQTVGHVYSYRNDSFAQPQGHNKLLQDCCFVLVADADNWCFPLVSNLKGPQFELDIACVTFHGAEFELGHLALLRDVDLLFGCCVVGVLGRAGGAVTPLKRQKTSFSFSSISMHDTTKGVVEKLALSLCTELVKSGHEGALLHRKIAGKYFEGEGSAHILADLRDDLRLCISLCGLWVGDSRLAGLLVLFCGFRYIIIFRNSLLSFWFTIGGTRFTCLNSKATRVVKL